MPRRLHCAVLVSLLCGCSTASSLIRPEGDGGWSQQRRAQELARAAAAVDGTVAPQASLAVEPQASLAVEPQASPAMEPQASLAVEPKASPAMEPQASPAMEPQASPAMEPQASPAMEPQASPAMEPKASPATEPRASPAVEPKASLAVEPKASVAMEPKASLAMEPKASLAMERHASVAMLPNANAQGAQPLTRPLALADALAMAERRNRTIAIAEQAAEMAADDVGVARSALLPKTTAQAAYTWYSDPLTNSIELPEGLLPPGTSAPAITVREQDFGNVSAAVRLALDISGELRHGLSAARASYRAEKARAWATTLGEQRAVVQTYLGVLQARSLRGVSEQTVALYERQLADAQSQFREGRLTKNGVLVVQVVLSSARQRLLREDVEVARLRRALNKVTGLPIDAATEIVDVAGRPSLPDVEEAVAEANRNSPALAAILEEAQSVDEKVTALSRARFPRVAASAGYDATSASTSQPQSYASAGFGVQWDLGTDLARESEITKLHHAATRARQMLDRSARELEELVRSAGDAERERLAAADASEVAVTQAEENLRIRREQFGVGRATSEDVLDAASLLARQRARLATARYQAYARRAELQQLMGRSLADLADVQSSQSHRPPAERPPR